MELSADLLSIVRRHALLNAYRHDGKAEVGAVLSKLLGERPELRPRARELAASVQPLVDEVNVLSMPEQRARLEAEFPEFFAEIERPKVEERRLPPLPGAERGKVVVRLPPEPSGHMHIGHAMAGIINDTYAKMYEGKLWLRFEDTNPRKVKREYYDSFREGYRWLGITWDHEKNVSDDLENLYQYGELLLRRGQAYACRCRPQAIKRNRFLGNSCSHRDASVEESLEGWERMRSGRAREGEIVVRLRGDMASLDYSLRDPTLFRVVDYRHPLKGRDSPVWPVYDFAVVVEDELCGVTHVLRSMEFHVALQEYLRELLGFRKVHVTQFSRFGFQGTPVAKRKLRPLIEAGLVSGWDDPRMPTAVGLRRRGIMAQAVRDFTVEVGYTKAEHEFDWTLLYAVNRKLLDPVTRRYFFVPDPVELRVRDAPVLRKQLRLHPDRDLGAREVVTGSTFYVPAEDARTLEPGSLVRLMELFNVAVERKNGAGIHGGFAGYEIRENVPKIQWVTERSIPFTVRVPGPLFVGDRFNEDGLRTVAGLAEEACRELEVGSIVQFARFGFCRIDAPGIAILAHK